MRYQSVKFKPSPDQIEIKVNLLLPMSISKRVSIAWDGSAPYEDTDTLVLTGRTYFVDVRVKKGSNPTALDWALAGTRTSTPGARPGG